MWRRFRNSLTKFRSNLVATILSVAFICGPVYFFTWYFDLIDSLSGRVSMTVLVSIFPIAVAFTNYRTNGIPWKEWSPAYWLVAFLFLANLLAASDRFDWFGVGVQVSLLILALMWSWVIWKIIGSNWLIWTCLALAFVQMMIYWVAALINFGESWQLLLLPLLLVLFLGAIWAPIASLTLNFAKRRRLRRIAGPGLQALAMAVLFLPVIFIAIAVPGAFQLGQEWSAVSLLIAGVLLSSLVAEPLRRFLLEWAGLWVSRP